MIQRSSKRSRGYPYPLALQVRLDALTDDTPPPRLLVAPAPPQAGISEEHFQLLVVGLAERFRWVSYHTLDSRGSDAGWPDLVLIRGAVALFIECKTEKGRLRPAQAAWGQKLLAAGLDWRIWRPGDFPEIVATLTAE